MPPLAPEVTALSQRYYGKTCELTSHSICSALSGALENGQAAWGHFARGVVQLDEQIVVKFGPNISSTDAEITAHIRKYSMEIQVPQFLGMLSVGGTTYAFTSLIEGCPLEKLWPDLSNADKSSVRDQLDVIFRDPSVTTFTVQVSWWRESPRSVLTAECGSARVQS